MPVYLSDEQLMLRTTVHDLLEQEGAVSQRRQLRDEEDPKGYSSRLWQMFTELGITGILVPEESGGLGLSHVETGIVMEEIGRNLTSSPFLGTAVGAVLALAGSPQNNHWLKAIVAGEVTAALAVDEAAKFSGRIALRAEPRADGFSLSGSKHSVILGHVADILIVAARTSGDPADDDGITLFLVESEAPGLLVEPVRLVDASIAARLTFSDVRVDRASVIGEVDQGGLLLQEVLLAMRSATAAELVGIAHAAMDMTLAYLKERRQFGVRIGSFQALQHRAAKLYSELEVATAINLKALQLLSEGDSRAAETVAVAKSMAEMAATLAVQEGVQMHGGIGMTDEHDIGFFLKRVRVLSELYGDANFHADKLATAAGY